MRIAFVAQPTDSLHPPVQGGSLAIWIYQVARICARRGHETVVFANHGSLFKSRSATAEDVRYIYTPTGPNRVINRLFAAYRQASRGRGKKENATPEFASPWQDMAYAMEVGRRSSRLRCDVVHIMNYSQFVPVIRRTHPQCKIFLHMECEWLTQLDHVLIKNRLASVDLITGCSEYITQKIARRFPEYERRCVTVPNAAPIAAQYDRADAIPYYILFVGRVSPEKGVHVLVRAFHEVLKRFPEARLHIVGGIGSAPYEYLVGLSDEPHVADLRVFYDRKSNGNTDPYGECLEEDAGAELGKRIFFEGRVDHTHIPNYYKRAAVLVNPSLSEAFGMSLVEAMMHRVPVVASRVGGMPYIVDHGRTGFLVDPADPSALAEAICEILGNKAGALRMGDAGRQKALGKYSWETTTDLLLEHFEALLA